MTAILLSGIFKVLIVEREKLPRHKSCSGVLIKKSVDLIHEYLGELPEYVHGAPKRTTGLSVITSSRTFDFMGDGRNIVRGKFDYWLTKEALKRGADVLEHADVLRIQRESSITLTVSQGKEIRAIETTLLIACDGINGCSRRLLGVKKQRNVVTYQKFYTATIDIDASKFYAYTSPQFSHYDAWVHAKDGMVAIGVIATKRSEAQHYHARFLDSLTHTRHLRITEAIREETWRLPVVIPEFDLLLNEENIFFAGEVAGLLNPFGEGISLALSSAIALATSCRAQRHNLSQYDAIVEGYTTLLSKDVSYMKRQWDFLMEIAPEFRQNVANSQGI
jgi:flavin-dependent dehydrogenase